MPPPIKAPREAVLRHLEAGHSPKLIAIQLGVSIKCIQKILLTELEARRVYIQTHRLRYPNIEEPPQKMKDVLKVIVG